MNHSATVNRALLFQERDELKRSLTKLTAVSMKMTVHVDDPELWNEAMKAIKESSEMIGLLPAETSIKRGIPGSIGKT
jgi:hypothetical protein